MTEYRRFDAPADPLSNFEPPTYRDTTAELLGEHHVGNVACQPYLSVESTCTVEEAIRELYQSGVSSLLVVEEGNLVGIFTERDVLERVAERYSRVKHLPVAEFMTSDPTIVYSEEPAAAAVAAIAIAGHRHVPVLDMDDQIEGIVSPRRVFQFIETSWD
ncbi:cyclic nucleotide-binding/CBS domain-containing protein [Rhodopirellula sp. MGV]|uniref:CBS domain-containing protein n=1 Tax=Rhodopirellula sp. MGV TaxID=2023130 RepID=UPI000B963B14|nr:CBS domain-containing protein [Rhodopirellula sp. MGV]OYP29415.1 hypothetical protein CGZ80_24725 [Rhodopirellula sp. MGV]PNY35721.1 CBS domain-containing protein [Rhodopirellula baltica]